MRSVTGLRCLYAAVAAIALGLSAERVNAQEEAPLPATPTPPPDVQEREKMAKPPAHPGKSPEVDELLKKLRLTRADIEQRKADKAQRELPATAEEPPDVKEQKKAGKAPKPSPRSPDLQDLIEKIRKQPGGAEKLEKAKKGGALVPDKPGGTALLTTPERMPGPRMNGPVVGDSSAHEQQNVMRVTKSAQNAYVPGLGSMWGYDYMPWTSIYQGTWGPLNRTADPNHAIAGGPIDIKPFMQAGIYLANPGYYIINFVAMQVPATLRKYDPLSGTYSDVTKWENEQGCVYESYPYFAKLAAGYHYFYWRPDQPATVCNIYLTEVSVTKF